MKSIIILLFALVPLQIFCQPNVSDTSLYKWLKACINLEGRAQLENQRDKLHDSMVKEKISFDYYVKRSIEMDRTDGSSGTAIYLRHNNLDYLITAAHVVLDTSSTNNQRSNVAYNKIVLINNMRDNAFQGEINDDPILEHLNVGPDYMQPFIISKELDLSIINLNTTVGYRFKETLQKRGYIPITINSVDTSCNISPGDKIMAIGYPRDLSTIERRKPGSFNPHFESWYVSVPLVTKGEISFVQKQNFNADVFIYKGNSGGPIIKNGKLVGIVSGIDIRPKLQGEVTYFEGNINLIKSSYIMPLIRQLEQRLTHHRNLY